MAEPQTPPAQPATPKPDDASSAAENNEPKKQPMHETHGAAATWPVGLSGTFDQGLAQKLMTLLRQGADPLRRKSALSFNTRSPTHCRMSRSSRVGTISMSPEARAEVTRLAGSAARPRKRPHARA